MSELRIWPVTRLKGRCRVPGDKSISHRAALLGALAKGTTRVRGFLWAGDPLATLDCLHRMAVPIARRGTELFIHGQERWSANTWTTTDARNSGTTARLLMGLWPEPGENGPGRGRLSLETNRCKDQCGVVTRCG